VSATVLNNTKGIWEFMNDKCYIFGAGEYDRITLPKWFSEEEADKTAKQERGVVIAADGGFHFLCEHRVKPDLLVGDFDSMSFAPTKQKKGKEQTECDLQWHLVFVDGNAYDGALLGYDDFLPDKENIICHQTDKDDTDMMLAVKEGLARGCREFYLYGGVGGRTDHMISNIRVLIYIAQQGARGFLVGAEELMTIVHNGSLTIPADQQTGHYLSVFCESGIAKGVTLKNLKYELSDTELTNDTTLCTSNEFIGKDAHIEVKEGTLLIVWQT
jgi:thiamine pyrophosphokinase